VDEQPVLDRIERLVEEEHRLWRASEEGGLTDPEHKRLHALRKELDQCWSALRLRRAGGLDRPLADSEVPDPPNDLDGPEPEPPHSEHGVHDESR
jgi:Protein of unknown function (DUF2630)